MMPTSFEECVQRTPTTNSKCFMYTAKLSSTNISTHLTFMSCVCRRIVSFRINLMSNSHTSLIPESSSPCD